MVPSMELVFASSNPHKLREIREILEPLGVRVLGLDDVGKAVPAPIEDAPTLEGNARIKAVAYARALGRTCLADDSGIEVDALGGAPGVDSAHYAGAGNTREERDRENRAKLVAELRNRGDAKRSARLVCTLCLAEPTGRVLFEARGTLGCRILEEERGGNGFGYDSLLYLPELDRTLAELTAEELNARSHRGEAVRALHAWLREHSASAVRS